MAITRMDREATLGMSGGGDTPLQKINLKVISERLKNVPPPPQPSPIKPLLPPVAPLPPVQSSVATDGRALHLIEYGIPTEKLPLRRPVVMIRGSLPSNIHQRFMQAPMFICANAAALENFGLSKQIDYPKSRDTHTYHEGYLHALPTSREVWSRNPRSGKNFSKHAAGDFVRAFFEAFRRVNKQTFALLQQKLHASAIQRRPDSPYNDSCGYVAKWLSQGMHFSDISVQVHWGSAIKKQELFWHSDAENSLLHLGISVKGSRILHSMRATTPTGQVTEVLETQNSGDFYLSSSALMNHAPEYPLASGYKDRIIAIQARFLYTTEELKAFRAQATPEGWASLSHILAEVLSAADIRSPQMTDVEAIIKERK